MSFPQKFSIVMVEIEYGYKVTATFRMGLTKGNYKIIINGR